MGPRPVPIGSAARGPARIIAPLRGFSAFYSDEDVHSDKPARELQLAAETGRCEEEGWRVRKDGGRFWANVVITAIRDHAGAPGAPRGDGRPDR
jgi:hypothetical protein